jgi:MFS family permease
MPGRRWVVLLAGLAAVTTGCTVQYGISFLIPALRAGGLDLAQAGAVAGAPIAGLLGTLFLWGAAADRWGERLVMTTGLSIGAVALLAWAVPGLAVSEPVRAWPLGVCLALAGAGTAAVHAASGRLVLGWFEPRQRGRAMAVRQAAQPIGVAVAALALPTLGDRGIPVAVAALGGWCLVGAVLTTVLVRNPPARPAGGAGEPTGSPYRGSSTLWRIHAASSLLVVPQFVTITFALVYLVDAQGWSSAPAGRLLAVAQIAGAVTRLLVGWWSDRAGSRLGPMRRLALGIGAVLLVLALATVSGPAALAVAALVVATVLSSSTNGLAFTAVAERAGSAWAGRALGVQNTAQNAIAAATPAAFGAVIAGAGYATAFGLALVFPLVASAFIPVRSEAARPGTAARSVPGGQESAAE